MHSKLFTEPKISPESRSMSVNWYVWFRFFNEATGKWVQKRYQAGINEFTTIKERLPEANALRKVLKEELEQGWNPLTGATVREQPAAPPIKVYTLSDSIEFIQKIKDATVRTKTKYAYRYIMKLFIDWAKATGIVDLPVKQFSARQAQEYMDHLLIEKQYSGRTFNDHLIVLRTFFNCFAEREWIDKNPFRSVKRKPQTVGRNVAFTESERALLMSRLRITDIRMFYFTQVMFHTFIRRTELTCIKVKHIDFRNETIIIPGEHAKNRHQESVVIHPDLMTILKEMKLDECDAEDYVFGRGLDTCPKKYKNPNGISERHNRFSKGLGIDGKKGLYSWKHTGVCHYYYLTNKDIYALMRQLRHRDMNTTQIYLKSLGLINNDAFKNARAA